MVQKPDEFIDLFDDEGHTYSLKREEAWTTTEAYIYVDRGAKVQIEPRVKCVELNALSDFTKEQYVETHLSSSGPIFKKIYERTNLALWLAYEREQEREDEDARLHARKPKDVRLRKPGTWGIPDEQTLRNAGQEPEHEDLTRAGDAMRKHYNQPGRTYTSYVEDAMGTGTIPGIESYSVMQGTNPADSKPMVHYTITSKERWGSLPLPEPNKPDSPKNHPIFNQEGQRWVDEIIKNERTYWYKNPSSSGRYGEFEIIGWLDEDDPKAARDAAQQGQPYVRMAGKGARWSQDGSYFYGFLEGTEMLVSDAAGKPLRGIRDTPRDKTPPPPPVYTPRPRKGNIKLKTVFLLVLVALILLGSIVGLFAYNHQIATNNANATATTLANNTATAQAAQATDQANTATAQAIAAQETADALQATANAAATATANAAATATAIASNPYPPNTGTLVINDPLSDNSQGYQWDESPTCVFTNGTYQVSTSGSLSTCTAQATNFTNSFVYQVDLTIIQGDCGGITFFSQGDNFNYTYFEVCQGGNSVVSICSNINGNIDCSGGGNLPPNPAVQTGLGQKNTLAVVFANNNLSFYVNQQLLQTFGSGMVNIAGGKIGVLADNFNMGGPGEMSYANVKVWTL